MTIPNQDYAGLNNTGTERENNDLYSLQKKLFGFRVGLGMVIGVTVKHQ